MQLDQKIKPMPKQKPSYGSLRLCSSEFPDVKNMTIGDAQTMTITVEVLGLRKADSWEVSEGRAKPNDIFAQIEIRGISKIPVKESTEGKSDKK